ncbi:MAG: alanyl-tRNA editing protein [Promethearchaeota archaeon]|nr:MAG: alanyl-tRNA editing protein [Candidatus Lokiarchaeota archaeon]
MESPLYLEDSYLKTWKSKVISVSEGKFIILSETAFYPKGGGQPYDKGIIRKNGKEYKVLYVGKFSGKISHEVDKEGLMPGDSVECELDWGRRYTFMRYHTASHLLSALVHDNYGAMITGNQIGLDQTRIDFSMADYNPNKFKKTIDKANKIIKDKIPIEIFMISREEAMKKPEITRLAMGLPDNIKHIRIVKIGDIDEQADGGTHVRNTKEIGKITFVKAVNKGKDNRRLYFKLI